MVRVFQQITFQLSDKLFSEADKFFREDDKFFRKGDRIFEDNTISFRVQWVIKIV